MGDDNNTKLTVKQRWSTHFLFNDYTADRWWFEVAEIYRRMVFVGILPLVSPQASMRASMGVLLAIMSVSYYREEAPFRVPFTNVIALVAQYVILIVYYVGLSLATGLVVDFGLKDAGLGLFLVAVNLSVVGLALGLGAQRLRRERAAEAAQLARANRRLEDATGFSATKFATTFRAVSNSAVPASHVLAFHYTSARGAARGLQSGVRSSPAHGGVLVSLRGPHQLTAAELRRLWR